ATIVLALVVSTAAVRETVEDLSLRQPTVDLSSPPPPAAAAGRPPLSDYSVIVERDIFNPPRPEEPVVEAPPLKARLLGTGVDANEQRVAIIEDANGDQRVYRVGEKVQGRLVKRIERDQVVVDSSGREDVLSVPIPVAELPVLLARAPAENDGDLRNTVLKPIEESVAARQAVVAVPQAEPVLRDGRPAGVRLSVIPRGSLFDEIGLRPGDVVTSVNGKQVREPLAMVSMFRTLKRTADLAIDVLRNSEKRVLPRDAEHDGAAEKSGGFAAMIERARATLAESAPQPKRVRWQPRKRWVPRWARPINFKVADPHEAEGYGLKDRRGSHRATAG
ncbi:MAG: type II secretion system protein N, partial [Candidatus Binatia bacterium]